MSRSDLATGVLLLAHRRLKTLAHALRTKEGLVGPEAIEIDVAGNRGPVAHQPLEARLRILADAAIAMLEPGDPIPPPATARLGFGLSRAAVTGTFGFTLPMIAARANRDRAWYRDALLRGSADPNLSRVAVPAVELVLDIGARALAAATTDLERARIRALVLGMLADVATRIVVGPVLRGAAADRTFADLDLGGTPEAQHAGGVTAERLLGGRAGQSWRDWWLPVADVPAAFFDGYAAAIAAQPAVTTPLGFRAHLDATTRGTPLDAAQLTTAYRQFLDGLDNPFTINYPGVPPIGARFGLAGWWGIMSAAFIGPPIALLISGGTDRSKLLWTAPAATPPPDGTSWLELAALGGLAGSVTPLVFPMLMWSGYPDSYHPFIEAIVFAVWRAVFGGVGLGGGTDSGLRTAMLLLQLVPDLVGLVQGIVELVRGHRAPGLLMLMQLMSALSMGLTMIAGAAFRGAGVTWAWDSFFPAWLIVLVICLGFAMIAAAVIDGQGGFRLIIDDPRVITGTNPTPPLLGALPAGGTPEPRALAMLFDDAALFRIPGVAGAVTRASFAYPSGARDLLELTWTGRAPLELTVDGARLSFQIQTDAPIEVIVPPGTTAQGLADLLTARVLDGGVAKLTVAQAATGELQPPLAFPGTIADPGDGEATRADHDRRRGEVITISTDAAHPTVLRHAPRAHNGVRFGVVGPARTQLEGWKIVPSELLGDVDVTAMGAASELAALLFLGATPELAPAAALAGAPGGPVRPAYEVFRRWNLDERAANEWRALVAGGARSERTAAGDPLRRPSPVAAVVADDADGRALLDRLGWIPTWRAWARMAADPTQDTAAPRPAPYSPPDGPPGTTVAPTNDLLSRAIRVLLNL